MCDEKKMLTVNLPIEMHAEIERLTEVCETSKGGVVRLALKEFVKNKKAEE